MLASAVMENVGLVLVGILFWGAVLACMAAPFLYVFGLVRVARGRRPDAPIIGKVQPMPYQRPRPELPPEVTRVSYPDDDVKPGRLWSRR